MAQFEKRGKSWSVRFRDTDENGQQTYKRLSGGYKTKKDAVAAYEDYIANREQRIKDALSEQLKKSDPNNKLFDDLINDYIDYQSGRVKETTLYHEKSRITTHILPHFTGKTIKQIEPIMIQKWQSDMKQYSYKYQKGLYQLMNHIMSYAQKTFKIDNVMDDIESPRNLSGKKEMQIWTPEQFSAFINCVNQLVYKRFYEFLYLTGCRRGEALALTWEDIDTDNHAVKIGKAYSGHAAASSHISTPKNESSYRTITIPEQLTEHLLELKFALPGPFVFGGERMLPVETIRRIMHESATRAGVPDIRVHDLRHSHASFLLSSGVPVTAVSKRLGHANVTQTYDTYSHMMPSDQTMVDNTLRSLEKTINAK